MKTLKVFCSYLKIGRTCKFTYKLGNKYTSNFSEPSKKPVNLLTRITYESIYKYFENAFTIFTQFVFSSEALAPADKSL